MTTKATEAFSEALEALVDRFRQEWDLTYAEAVGCLTIVASDIANDARESGLTAL